MASEGRREESKMSLGIWVRCLDVSEKQWSPSFRVQWKPELIRNRRRYPLRHHWYPNKRSKSVTWVGNPRFYNKRKKLTSGECLFEWSADRQRSIRQWRKWRQSRGPWRVFGPPGTCKACSILSPPRCSVKKHLSFHSFAVDRPSGCKPLSPPPGCSSTKKDFKDSLSWLQDRPSPKINSLILTPEYLNKGVNKTSNS
jgi:hypothetical protein